MKIPRDLSVCECGLAAKLVEAWSVRETLRLFFQVAVALRGRGKQNALALYRHAARDCYRASGLYSSTVLRRRLQRISGPKRPGKREARREVREPTDQFA
jgi:hypothetical protein